MEQIVTLTCISCPLGCELRVIRDENGQAASVEGNACKRGDAYGRKEVTAPMRIVTSTVKVLGAERPLVSVKTASEIPKEKIFACMEAIKALAIQAPVKQGEILLPNIADTGADLVATSEAQRI